MEIKSASAVSVKSSGGFSPYVQSQLSGYSPYGFWLSPSLAYWLWEKSDTVGDACDRISTAFTSIEPVLKDKKTGEYLLRPEDHPLLELLDNPGFNMDSNEFKYTLMTAFLVTGGAYPVLSGNVNYDPISIHTYHSNKANLVPDGDNTLKRISFSTTDDKNVYDRMEIPKRKTTVFQAPSQLSETMQIRVVKKKDGVYPQSPLERIYYQTMTKYFGNVHNSSLMKNASRPGGFWAPDKDVLSQQQYEAFKNEIAEKFSGPQNAGRNIVAPTPVKYENLMLNPRDLDFAKLIDIDRTEIYNTYQIPLALVSEKVMTLSNFENSMIAFYDLAVLPRAKFILKRLGDFALPRYKDGDRYELTFNEKDLSALKARMLERAKKMREIESYSEDEIRAETGYESIGEGGDQIWKRSTSVPAGIDDDYTDDGTPIDGEE